MQTIQKVQKWTDTIATVISSLMCAAMMLILIVNVILRYIPGIGGFKWYMESSQYLNVWSMLIVGIAITARGEHLRVNIMEDLCAKHKLSHAIQKTLVSVLMIVFYGAITYSSYILATKARQAISTMPQFTMGQMYSLIPVACGLCCLAAIVDLIADLTVKKSSEPAEQTKGGDAA